MLKIGVQTDDGVSTRSVRQVDAHEVRCNLERDAIRNVQIQGRYSKVVVTNRHWYAPKSERVGSTKEGFHELRQVIDWSAEVQTQRLAIHRDPSALLSLFRKPKTIPLLEASHLIRVGPINAVHQIDMALVGRATSSYFPVPLDLIKGEQVVINRTVKVVLDFHLRQRSRIRKGIGLAQDSQHFSCPVSP